MTRPSLLALLTLAACGGADDTDTSSAGDTDTDSISEDAPLPTDHRWRLAFDGAIDEEAGSLAWESERSYGIRWTDGLDGDANGALAAESCVAYRGTAGGTDEASMSLWVRPLETWGWDASRHTISVFDYGTWQIYFDEGTLHAEVYTDGQRTLVDATTGTDLDAGVWTHLAWVKRDDTLSIYVDGSLHTSVDYPAEAGVMGASGLMYFGCSARENAFIDLADVRFYDRGLESLEVIALADAH